MYIAGSIKSRAVVLWRSNSTRFLYSPTVGYAYSAEIFRFRPRFLESAPGGAKNVLCLTVRVLMVVAGSGGSVQTVWVRRFTGMISSFLFRLSESKSETESACTIRVPEHTGIVLSKTRIIPLKITFNISKIASNDFHHPERFFCFFVFVFCYIR